MTITRRVSGAATGTHQTSRLSFLLALEGDQSGTLSLSGDVQSGTDSLRLEGDCLAIGSVDTRRVPEAVSQYTLFNPWGVAWGSSWGQSWSVTVPIDQTQRVPMLESHTHQTSRLSFLLALEGDEGGTLSLMGDAQSGTDSIKLEGDVMAIVGSTTKRVTGPVP